METFQYGLLKLLMMKKIFYSILITLSLVSCSNDFLDISSLTSIAENNFWQSESDAFLALNAVYSTLQSKSLFGGNLNGGQGIPGFDGFGDNAFNAWKWEGPGKFMEGTLGSSHWFFSNIWSDLYQGINRVNSVIQNVKDASEDLLSVETKNELLGQAMFLRGLFYFNLAVYFEEAPLILAPQILAEAQVPKNSYSDITNQVIEDLKFAANHLPEMHPVDLYGYATKGAALGLLARVQLYNHNYTGENGVLTTTEEVMNLGYSLHPDYAELFTPDGEYSPEVVFAIRFLRGDDTNNGEIFSGTYKASPKVDIQPLPNLVMITIALMACQFPVPLYMTLPIKRQTEIPVP